MDEIILKSQQRFKSEVHNVHIEKINKIALSSNDDKQFQTLNRITTYPYGYNHWESMQNKIVKIWKMINSVDYTNENKREHKSKWPHIPDHPYGIWIIEGSGSGKRNALLYLIKN